MKDADLYVAAAGTALVQLVSHWFPWNRLTGRELRAPVTYVVGVAPIMGTYTVWATHRCRLEGVEAARGLAIITAASGLAVIGAYIIDAALGGLMTWHVSGGRDV
jgi:hypothetical protein